MEIISVSNSDQLALKTNEWIKNEVQSEETKSIFLPAGNTPMPLYKYWNENQPPFLKELTFQPVDDVIKGSRTGVFEEFFTKHLPKFKGQIRPIQDDLPLADLTILGLGENGHVAFHEPGIPLDFFGGCIRLSDKTCSNLGIDNGAWGLTYGLASFLSTRSILVIVSGEKKQSILRRFIEEEGTFPATYLKNHVRLTVIADQSAIGDSLEF